MAVFLFKCLLDDETILHQLRQESKEFLIKRSETRRPPELLGSFLGNAVVGLGR